MSRLIICCEDDLPSANMRDALMRQGGWEDGGISGDASFSVRGNDVLMTIPSGSIYRDHLDKDAEAAGYSVDSVVFMSKHSAASGRPALTVHPIGNYNDADFGGRSRTLVPSAPGEMSDALRRISTYNKEPGVQVCFEATHHGPYLEKPTFFIEIGSDESHWGDILSAELLARVISEIEPADGHMALVGIGGGHYAPRFTEAAIQSKVDFGHILPVYQLEGRNDDEIARMIESACSATGADSVYIHRKSMKGPEEHRVKDIVISSGFQSVSSKDFEPIDGNPRRSL